LVAGARLLGRSGRWPVRDGVVMIIGFAARVNPLSPLRARGARPVVGPVLLTGSLANAIGRAKNRRGGSRRGCEQLVAARSLDLLVSRRMLLEAIGPPGRGRDGPVSMIWCRGHGPALTYATYAARARPGRPMWYLRRRSPTTIGRAKTAEGG